MILYICKGVMEISLIKELLEIIFYILSIIMLLKELRKKK
nr:MAG TPA: hypothetical protein [Caudoviricetes sp.]